MVSFLVYVVLSTVSGNRPRLQKMKAPCSGQAGGHKWGLNTELNWKHQWWLSMKFSFMPDLTPSTSMNDRLH